MERFSYKNKFLTIILIMFTIVLIVVVNLFEGNSSTNLGLVSKNNFKNKILEREEYIKNFIIPYENVIKALKDNIIVKEYISLENDKSHIESLFLTINKSLPYLTQIRLFDLEGNEKVNIQKNKIIKTLQNKNDREYFHTFKKIKKNKMLIPKSI